MGIFHGRTVSLPEGSSYLVHSLKLALSFLLLMFTFDVVLFLALSFYSEMI